MSARVKAFLSLLAVLLLGVVIGGAGATVVITRKLTALLDSPKDTMARLYGFELDRRLHLSREQREQVEAIVRADHAPLAKLMQTLEPELVQLRQRRHERIRALLTAEQQPRFDEMARRFEQRHREEIDLE
jgi:hypothetical protein